MYLVTENYNNGDKFIYISQKDTEPESDDTCKYEIEEITSILHLVEYIHDEVGIEIFDELITTADELLSGNAVDVTAYQH